MRLRSENKLPQAGTGSKSERESRSKPSGLGRLTYSGGGNVLQRSAQFPTVAEHDHHPNCHDSSAVNINSPSSSSSLFSSIPSTNPYTRSPTHSTASSMLSEDVVQETESVAILAPTTSSLNSRKKWSKPMNEFILRTYFQLTLMETDTNGYLPSLHTKFIEKFPEMQMISRQRLGDQRRAIINKKLLPQSDIDNIRSEVNQELNIRINTRTPNIQVGATTQPQVMTRNHVGRMRWSKDHNEAIMRAYYKITQLETNISAYRGPLHQAFVNAFPTLNFISEQRVADQRRLIIQNRYISEERLQAIKDEVASEIPLQNNGDAQAHTSMNIVSTQAGPAAEIENDCFNNLDSVLLTHVDSCVNNTPENTELQLDQNNTEIEKTFQECYNYFRNTDPTQRSYIPKQKSSKKLAAIVNYINSNILPKHIFHDTEFITLQNVLYCAAWTAAKINGAKIQIPPRVDTSSRFKIKKPKWQIRLESRIVQLRAQIGRLTQYISGNRNNKLVKHVNYILNKYRIHATHENQNTQLAEFLDTLKQKLSALSNRLQRYKTCTLRKTQNKQFTSNEKQFYRELRTPHNNPLSSTHSESIPTSQNTPRNSPPAEELRGFWAGIWENPVQHSKEAEWIQNEYIRNLNSEAMDFQCIPIEVFGEVIKKLHNWKAPGSDNIHNFWYKKFTYLHPFIHNYINKFIEQPDTLPSYVTVGTTYMLPKDPSRLTDPAKYRPITCLQTIYKIITSCLTHIIYEHIDKNSLLAEQQKGCRKYSQGCKEQLTIDSVILKHTQLNKSDLFSMYVDYKKAFDSVPHTWLLQVLEIYRINPIIISFLQNTMTRWATRLSLTTESNSFMTEPIKVQRGIFQGDALSPLWFCLALNPLSNMLNSLNLGYKLEYKVDENTPLTQCSPYKLSHLLYMDDIKLYGSTEEELLQMAEITENFSRDICMDFGIDKCRINSTRGGQQYEHQYCMQNGEIVEPLAEAEVYKYLGYNQAQQIQHKNIKTSLTKQFKHRLNTILRSHLYSKNMFKAVNTFAIPVLTYSFGIINWNKTELKSLQRIINTTMSKNRKHHPRSCIQRMTLPRTGGGRGLIDILNLHNTQITILRTYFHNKSNISILHNAIVQNDKKFTPLNLLDRTQQKNEIQINMQTKLNEWARKTLHGRHLHDLNQPTVDKIASNEWLRRGELFPETEGFMLAIQDQVIETKNYKKHIMKLPSFIDDTCRKCKGSSETIQHVTGACRAIVQTDYKHRHDQVAAIIHQSLAFKLNLIREKTAYYKYTPQTVIDNANYKLYWDRTILTDKTVHYNRPDITLHDKKNETVYLIDIAVPNTHNLSSTHTEKLTKYTDLAIELKTQWKVKTVRTIPIVLSSTGIIPRTLHTSLKLLDLHSLTYILLQKAIILNTCRIVRKFLSTE